MALKKISKLYYSIGDVSKITGLKQYVLRYWETSEVALRRELQESFNCRDVKHAAGVVAWWLPLAMSGSTLLS